VESDQKTADFISGVSDDIHSVIIAGSKADLALQMTLQVRNKVMDAYKEIMNMQI
jgi:flagellar hook-basal body complex protein FliE